VILSTTAMAFATGGSSAWLKEFLARNKGMSGDEATQLLVFGLCSGVGGILAGGRVADRLRRRVVSDRLWTVALGMALTLPCAILSIELSRGPALYAVVAATLFFITWYHAPMAASIDDLAPAGRSVAAQGLVIFTMAIATTSLAVDHARARVGTST
jgi:hypothetical protein